MFIYNLTDVFNEMLNTIEKETLNNDTHITFKINYVENTIKPDSTIITNLNKNLREKKFTTECRKEYINTYFDKTQTIFQSRVSINNSELKKKLLYTKNNINKNIKNWDKVKTLTNDYEFVCINSCKLLDTNLYYKKYYNKTIYFNYTSHKKVKIDSIMLQSSKLFTLSRSFYKMIETINTFFPHIKHTYKITSLHLAEGPGGFIEALNYIRNTHNPHDSYNNDTYYGITLLDDIVDNNIPSWKKSSQFLKRNTDKVKILTGIDNTGDLTNPKNLIYLLHRFRYNKCNLVTGDGGLDFSCNINYQEEMASKLIYAQIMGAFATLSIGGNFMLKIFDMNNILTADMIFLLYNYFQVVYIYKPKTSRLANSEKYLICINYKGCKDDILSNMIYYLNDWNKNDDYNKKLIENYKSYKLCNKKIDFKNYIYKQIDKLSFSFNNKSNILDIINTKFYKCINKINEEIINYQIKNINYTIKYCDLLSNKKLYIKTINNRLITQTLNAQKWCIDNDIPYYNKIYN
jgi:hypothetical protein